MSAFMCSDLHLNSLISAAVKYGLEYWFDGSRRSIPPDPQRAALILQAQNARSVNYRYVHNVDAQCHDEPITYARAPVLEPLTIIKLCHCYAYQSCETDDWERTEAHAIVRAIESSASMKLPGYDAAPWGI